MKVARVHYEAYDIYGGRAHFGVSFTDSIYCKPKKIAPPGIGRVATINRFRKYWYAPEQRWLRLRAIEELRDKTVGCWCKPRACHLDVIAEYVNGFDPAVESLVAYDIRMTENEKSTKLHDNPKQEENDAIH